MFKRTILAGIAASVLVVASYAQESATIVMRSGERISAQLLDHGGVGFTIRVDGQERQIPTRDVAVVDFTGNADLTEADQAELGSGHLLLLRSGERIKGQFYDIGGTAPLRITMKTESGERHFTSNEVGRIVLARRTGAAATTGSASTAAIPQGQGIAVPGNQAWTPTGLTVRRGEVLRFSTTGEVRWGPEAGDVAGAAGAKSQRTTPGAPLSQNYVGALIGRVGTGAPFAIGDQSELPMPAAGQLFLGINDDVVSDNQGGFRVNVQRQSRR